MYIKKLIKPTLFTLIFGLTTLAIPSPAESDIEWLPLDTKQNKYELNVNSLKYLDSRKKYLDVKYRILIGGAENEYSVISSAITCTDTVASEQYYWERFNGNGDKLDVQRRHKSVSAAAKQLENVVGGYGTEDIKAICRYVWKNEEKINRASNLKTKEIVNAAPIVASKGSDKNEMPLRLVVNKTPLPFSYSMPNGWSEGRIVSGNTKVSLVSPKGKPEAECAVLAIEMKGVSATQQQINLNMNQLPTKVEMETELGMSWKNVKLESVSKTLLSGFPAQQAVFQHGSKETGWALASNTTAVIAPNISLSVSCGGTGGSLESARSAFNYWRTEINIFPTTIKVQNK